MIRECLLRQHSRYARYVMSYLFKSNKIGTISSEWIIIFPNSSFRLHDLFSVGDFRNGLSQFSYGGYK